MVGFKVRLDEYRNNTQPIFTGNRKRPGLLFPHYRTHLDSHLHSRQRRGITYPEKESPLYLIPNLYRPLIEVLPRSIHQIVKRWLFRNKPIQVVLI